MAVILIAPISAVEGAPIVEIRDRSEIVLDPIRRADGRVFVSGRVIESGSGDGAPFASVKLWIDDRRIQLYADELGYFRYSFESALLPPDESHYLKLEFEGDGHRDGSHVELEDFDLAKQPVRIELRIPSAIELGTEPLNIPVTTRSGEQPISIRLQLSMQEQRGAKARDLPPLQSNAQGQATLTLDAETLSSPGTKTLHLRFSGSEDLDAAHLQRRFSVTTSSELSFRFRDKEIEQGDKVVATGRLLDGAGNGIPLAAVSLELSEEVIATVRTDERGDYEFKLGSDELGLGLLSFQASFSPSQSWVKSARSKPQTLTIKERQPVPIRYTLAAFGLTSFALLSFVGMRTRPWTRWRRKGEADDDEDEEETVQRDEPPKTGLSVNKAKRNVTLRRHSHFDVNGLIRDAVTRKGVAEAEIVLDDTESEIEAVLTSDESGAFRSEPLQGGTYRMSVRAHGYMSEQVEIELPHRGELHGARVDLLPVREKIFTLYKKSVRPLLPEQELWGIWTPRQILDHVRSLKQSPALARLTSFVEESFFSQRIPGEEEVDRCRRRIADFRRESHWDGQES